MGDTKLAKQIYSLALEVESSTNPEAGGVGYEKAARAAALAKIGERMVKFTDPAGNSFMLPYDIVGQARWMYSPYDRSRAERDSVINVSLQGRAEEVFKGEPLATDKEAADKVAEKMVQFRDEAGRIFVLPYNDVGTARWAYSPWDRSRAQREKILNVQFTGKLEEALGF